MASRRRSRRSSPRRSRAPLSESDEWARGRAGAWIAITAQAVFVAGWALGGTLERGYSPVRMPISELGRRGAAHPWIFDAAITVWGLGFIALALAVAPALRTRPWRRVAPSLFALVGVLVIAEAPLRLDCAASVDHGCSARQAAGALSWHHYAHLGVSFAIVIVIAVSPFALARAEWPSRVGRLALRAGIAGTALTIFALSPRGSGDAGLAQRLELIVVHAWVIACAIAVLIKPRARGASLVAGAPRAI